MADDKTQPGRVHLSREDQQRLDYSEMFGRIMKRLANANNHAIHEEFVRRSDAPRSNSRTQSRRV